MNHDVSKERFLFITWDGPQTDYLEGLFLPIFDKVQAMGFQVDVLQFGWDDHDRAARHKELYSHRKANYFHSSIFRTGALAGPLLTLAASSRPASRLVRATPYSAVICRSVFAATVGLVNFRGCPLVYDSDGLALDERVEFGGLSILSPIYQLLRFVEGFMTIKSLAVLNRTAEANEVLRARAGPVDPSKFFVSSNGRDARVFRPLAKEERLQGRERLGIPESAPLVVHAGSLGSQYCPELLLKFFRETNRLAPESRLLVLSRDPDLVKALAGRFEGLSDSIIYAQCLPGEVPSYLGLADLGVSFREEAFSMRGVEPVKIGEYLLCGLPVVTYGHIGSLKRHAPSVYGFHLNDSSQETLSHCAGAFLQQLPSLRESTEARRTLAQSTYSLEASAQQYFRALRFAVDAAEQSEGFGVRRLNELA